MTPDDDITMHSVVGYGDDLCGEGVTIEADTRQDGGASHRYLVRWGVTSVGYYLGEVDIEFQKGPLREGPANGLTNEALLAIVIDRLEGFQAGNYSCRENALALTKCQEALLWLNHRTAKRKRRGVEGLNVA